MKKIIISRTDSIGDVILTLPVAGILKKYFPGSRICFIGRQYTRPVIEACEHVDEFIDGDEIVGSRQLADLSLRAERSNKYLKDICADAIIHVFPVKEICRAAKKAGIPLRIGTSHRWFTWLYCNKLVHFSRRNSDLHEAQLNLKMLEPLGIKPDFSVNEIPGYYGLSKVGSWQSAVEKEYLKSKIVNQESSIQHPASVDQVDKDSRFKLNLHPKSKGSAREWGLDNFSRLINLLPEDRFNIIITGTKEEGILMKDFLKAHESRITDLTGKLTLAELMNLIGECDGIVAASTGPLHIAAALGKHAIGLFAPMKPIHPGRWAPLGVHADFLVLDKKCSKCRHTADCECIRSIRPEDVAVKLETAAAKLS